ncbi:MAG: HD domain-containing protein [Candidatus Omnitrophica bacterium]|nr:HD domain-containing protein [Candidatus Omnitrophota bacterium]
MKSFIKFILGSHRRLNNIIRFNTRIKTYNESVAAHSFFVAFYSYILALYLKINKFDINIEKLLIKALLHDIEECISGDILTPFKKLMSKEYEQLGILSVNEVTKDLYPSIREKIINIWANCKKDFEGQIVDFCDDLSGYIYCLEQIKTGNTYFIDIIKDYKNRLIKVSQKNPILKEIVKELTKKENIK